MALFIQRTISSLLFQTNTQDLVKAVVDQVMASVVEGEKLEEGEKEESAEDGEKPEEVEDAERSEEEETHETQSEPDVSATPAMQVLRGGTRGFDRNTLSQIAARHTYHM